jgi:hypothetical protein
MAEQIRLFIQRFQCAILEDALKAKKPIGTDAATADKV